MSEAQDQAQSEQGEPEGIVRVLMSRRNRSPFFPPEYAYVSEDAAAHWSDRVWHGSPPR